MNIGLRFSTNNSEYKHELSPHRWQMSCLVRGGCGISDCRSRYLRHVNITTLYRYNYFVAYVTCRAIFVSRSPVRRCFPWAARTSARRPNSRTSLHVAAANCGNVRAARIVVRGTESRTVVQERKREWESERTEGPGGGGVARQSRISFRLLWENHVARPKWQWVFDGARGSTYVKVSSLTDLLIRLGRERFATRASRQSRRALRNNRTGRMIERVSPTKPVHFSPRWVPARLPLQSPDPRSDPHMLRRVSPERRTRGGEVEKDESVECFKRHAARRNAPTIDIRVT